jgi:hypothetical protein
MARESLPVAALALVFLVIGKLNDRAASKLQRETESLNAAEKESLR